MNNRQFVEHVENTLGWAPPDDGRPRWKVLTLEAAKLKRKRETNPRLYSWDNLLLTVEMLRRDGAEVASPAAVCWHVRRALARASLGADPNGGDLAGRVHVALGEAFVAGEHEWVERLARARGEARHEALAEWAEVRDAGPS